MNEDERWCMMANEVEWRWVNMSEDEWRWMTLDEHDWKWIQLDGDGWDLINMTVDAVVWMALNEHERAWMEIWPFLLLPFDNIHRCLSRRSVRSWSFIGQHIQTLSTLFNHLRSSSFNLIPLYSSWITFVRLKSSSAISIHRHSCSSSLIATCLHWSLSICIQSLMLSLHPTL